MSRARTAANLPTGITVSGDTTTISGKLSAASTPMFSVRSNTSQWLTLPTNTNVKPVAGIGAIAGFSDRYGFNISTGSSGAYVVNNCYDPTTGVFTAPMNGMYLFGYGCHVNVPNNADYANCVLYLNGAYVHRSLLQAGYYFTKASASAEIMPERTCMMYMYANDTCALYINNSSGNVKYHGDYLGFWGTLIG